MPCRCTANTSYPVPKRALCPAQRHRSRVLTLQCIPRTIPAGRCCPAAFDFFPKSSAGFDKAAWPVRFAAFPHWGRCPAGKNRFAPRRPRLVCFGCLLRGTAAKPIGTSAPAARPGPQPRIYSCFFSCGITAPCSAAAAGRSCTACPRRARFQSAVYCRAAPQCAHTGQGRCRCRSCCGHAIYPPCKKARSPAAAARGSCRSHCR